jgi:hypothetical protein
MHTLRVSFLSTVLLWGCNSTAERPGAGSAEQSPAGQATPPAAEPAPSPVAPSASPLPPPALDPGRGQEIGLVFEAFLSPHQESNEEETTPSSVPKQFRSTTSSLSRDQREAASHRGHGQIRFSKDLSRAFVDVRIEGVDPATVNMFHIHCGKPGILGPILVDFALAADIPRDLSDGLLSFELRNEHIAKTAEQGHGVIGALTMGCVIGSPSLESLEPAKVSTIAGMAHLALERELYFNLHTTGQTYYGDIRGQVYPVENVTLRAAAGKSAN